MLELDRWAHVRHTPALEMASILFLLSFVGLIPSDYSHRVAAGLI